MLPFGEVRRANQLNTHSTKKMAVEIVTNLLAGVGFSTLSGAIACAVAGISMSAAVTPAMILAGLAIGFTGIPLIKEILKPAPSPYYYAAQWN